MRDADGSAMVKVPLLNDDETTMEFVVQVLESVFGKTREEALKLVLEIHRDESGECQSSSRVQPRWPIATAIPCAV